MVIYNNVTLVQLNYTDYKVVPMKTHGSLFTDYQCELGEEDHYSVMANVFYKSLGGRSEIKLGTFKDQDKAHQFAELLTECLTKIKAFTDENTETK